MAVETVTFWPSAWGQIAHWLGRIGDAPEHLDNWSSSCLSGETLPLSIDIEGKQVGAALVRIDEGRVCVDAMAGSSRADLSAAALAFAVHVARETGARGVLCWTKRKGLAHKMRRAGCRVSEEQTGQKWRIEMAV